MGIFSAILGAPLAPLKGTVWVAEQVRNEAEKRYYDPSAIRRQLEEVSAAKESGAISEDEADELERDLVARLLESTRRRKTKENP
ncbi:gas vesicle protein GvpG [Brevibacterium sp. RIT 803]|uniref:gas vesicle protein GvpG n=1 Tax=Brevibacterium sp. RIT 803 TaxID=2810210 RepID=UPI00194EBF22|nr:gas vesicle protein GvpG [Brevibacterium sp. RIT 803]MBM6589133.1 gas vesicle protein GvpG [Brevibacterium sp. RIT 803]